MDRNRNAAKGKGGNVQSECVSHSDGFNGKKKPNPRGGKFNSRGSKPVPNTANKQERWDFAEKAARSFENDKSWYNRFQDLVKNFANFNFRVPVGTVNNFGILGPDADRFPGVMSLFFYPTAGDKADGLSSPLNMAANRLYQFVRFENNGSSAYDRGDLMLYLLAMDSGYMFYAWMRRLYGLLNSYSNMNRYMPQAMVQANRANFEDLHKHIADFRGYINEYAARLSMLPIPGSLSYLMRHMWMCDNVFVDEDSAKCQFYMFVPFYWYKFGIEQEGDWAGAPYLDYVRPSYGALMDFDAICNFGNDLLNPLVANEDFNLIGADIIKAFGTNGLFTVTSVPDDYKVYPVYSEEVLDQIENATIMGNPACIELGGHALNYGHAVYWDPNTNTLVPNVYAWVPYDSTNTWQLLPDVYLSNRLINFRRNDINNDDIMVATRLTVGASEKTFVADAGHYITMSGLASEVIASAVIYFFTNADTGKHRLGQTQPIYYGLPLADVQPDVTPGMSLPVIHKNVQSAEAAGRVMNRETTRQLSLLDLFQRHPSVMIYPAHEFVYRTGDSAEPSDYSIRGVNFNYWDMSVRRLGDVDNYAFFTKDDIKSLSDVALQSEFYVPMTAAGPVNVGKI